MNAPAITDGPAPLRVGGAQLSAAAVAALALAALAGGVGILSVTAAVLCVAMMRRLYQHSDDLFDLRAIFFVAVLLFLVIPGIVLDLQLRPPAFEVFSELVRSLRVSRDDLRLAQAVVLAGAAAVAAALLLRPARSLPAGPGEPRVLPRVWLVYTVAILAVAALAALQFGSMQQLLLYAISPLVRQSAVLPFATPAAFLLLVCAAAAYYAAARLRRRWLRALLFLPPILLALPVGSRGMVLTLALVGAAGVLRVMPRHPLRYALAACILLPPFASAMFRLRYLALTGGFGEFTLLDMYADFAQESMMVPVLAHALRALHEGLVGYTFGADLLLYPLFFVPRAIWPSKPWPLDFRLNEQLGLNDGDVFGTPISLFGGVYFNFTPVGFLPVMAAFGLALAYLFDRSRRDPLVKVFAVTFVVDIVRVGDISRELVTFSMGLAAAWLLRATVLAPSPSRTEPVP